MKIIHLNANSAGGAFIAANRLSAALNESGMVSSSHLVFSGQPGQGYTLWADHFWKKQWAFYLHAKEKLQFLTHEKGKEIRFAFSHGSTGIRVDKLPGVREADVVHLHWINKGFISLDGLEALYRSGKKVVWTAHDLWPFTGGCYHPRNCNEYEKACGNCPYLKQPSEDDLSAMVFQRKKELYTRYNPVVVVPGNWSKEMADRSGLSRFLRLKEIGHFIDTDIFVPGKSTAGRKFRILFSSMNLLNPKKGIYDLAKAINALPNELCQKIELTLLGHAKEDVPPFNCDVNQAGVVRSQDELSEFYRKSDLMVIPSHEETFGLTAAEAQACGLPVLAYDAGELAYNIIHEETGWLCPTGNTNALQNALVACIDMDTEQLQQFGVNARAFAVKKFGKQRVVNAYLDCYREL